eukprot:3044078-Lingulodinium_polyedra.AAC.1
MTPPPVCRPRSAWGRFRLPILQALAACLVRPRPPPGPVSWTAPVSSGTTAPLLTPGLICASPGLG